MAWRPGSLTLAFVGRHHDFLGRKPQGYGARFDPTLMTTTQRHLTGSALGLKCMWGPASAIDRVETFPSADRIRNEVLLSSAGSFCPRTCAPVPASSGPGPHPCPGRSRGQ